MIIINPETTPIKQNPFNTTVKKLFHNEKNEILLLELEQNKNLEAVKIDNNAFFYILEGAPQIIINDEEKIIKAEALVFCPAGSTHCINNPNNYKARILVIKQLI